MIKLKLNSSKLKDVEDGVSAASTSQAQPTPPPPPPAERKPSVKLSFKPKTPATEAPPTLPAVALTKDGKPKKKPGRKPASEREKAEGGAVVKLSLGSKKRPRTDSDAADGEIHTAKRTIKPTERAQATGISAFKKPDAPARVPTLKLKTNLSSATTASGLKLKLSAAPQSALASGTPTLKIKAKGKPPKRDPGVGYDSEDEEAENDPVVESQFILRMQPGPDCDYLRNAIVESGIKHRPDGTRASGPDVWFKFFDKDGRRGVVSVRGNLYAASLLDLPCIIEAMKSWDRKGWYKTTDICQILLVLGRVDDEDKARNYALPSYVDKDNMQFPHGLTPPMQWVRKRRFRRRVNRRHIERVEQDVEELIARDKEWERHPDPTGDNEIVIDFVDPDAQEADADGEADGYDDYELQDADGNVYSQGDIAIDEDQDDDFDLAAALDAGLEDEDEDDLDTGAADDSQIQTIPATVLATDQTTLHASPDSLAPPTPVLDLLSVQAATPASNTGTEDESDEDDYDDDDDVASDEEDEEEKARRQERQQALAEVEETRKEIRDTEERWKRQQNALLKAKIKKDLEKLRADLQVKLSGLGVDEDGEGQGEG